MPRNEGDPMREETSHVSFFNLKSYWIFWSEKKKRTFPRNKLKGRKWCKMTGRVDEFTHAPVYVGQRVRDAKRFDACFLQRCGCRTPRLYISGVEPSRLRYGRPLRRRKEQTCNFSLQKAFHSSLCTRRDASPPIVCYFSRVSPPLSFKTRRI